MNKMVWVFTEQIESGSIQEESPIEDTGSYYKNNDTIKCRTDDIEDYSDIL